MLNPAANEANSEKSWDLGALPIRGGTTLGNRTTKYGDARRKIRLELQSAVSKEGKLNLPT